VNLGIIDQNPCTVAGVVQIMEELHRYVPTLANGNLLKIPTHGDCLAVERMIDSQRCRAADLTAVDRLEGLEPVAQEFHHRGLMLQVCLLSLALLVRIDTLFRGIVMHTVIQNGPNLAGLVFG